MSRKLLISIFLFSVVACGGGKSELIDACVDEGNSKKSCACMAEKLQEDLSSDAFDAMVLGAKGDEEAASAAMKKLDLGEKMKVGVVMLGVVADCGVMGFN